MNNNNRSIIIVALFLAFFLAWYPLMRKLGWLPEEDVERREVPEYVEEPDIPDSPLPSGEPQPETAEPGIDREVVKPRPQVVDVDTDAPALSDRPVETLEMRVENFLAAGIAADYGGITEVMLEQFETYGQDANVKLGNYRFPYAYLFSRNERIALGAGKAQIVGPRHVSLERTAMDGRLTIVEHWRFSAEHPYRLQYTVELDNQNDDTLVLDDLSVMLGGMVAEDTESVARLSGVGRVDLAAELKRPDAARPDALAVNEIDKIDAAKARALADDTLEWVALHNKYFLFYLSETTRSFAGCTLGTYTVQSQNSASEVNDNNQATWIYGSAHLPVIAIPEGETVTLEFDGYAGPKEYTRLRDIGRGLESIMRLDLFMFFRVSWMGFISTTILRSLIWIKEFIGYEWGYGIAIIIITIIIKTLFWPLTHKSTVSMRRMQKLQPLIKELREKYKDDAQKMNRKLMELYREHKVNPVGGCLPIVFQIPVFFALFNTLRGAIELRQVSFLWVADLSMPDTLPWLVMGLPIRPLAILMGGTMFLQQKMAPSTGDPSQRRMMMFMTVFFMFIFYSMPAGLTLYWTTNQVLTIFQNYLIKKFESGTTGAEK